MVASVPVKNPYFEDFAIGQVFRTESYQIEPSAIAAYVKATGDTSGSAMNVANGSSFDIVPWGFLIGKISSLLVQEQLLTNMLALRSADCQFSRPARVWDKLVVEAYVKAIKGFGEVIFKCVIYCEGNGPVMTYEASVVFADQPVPLG